MADDIAVIRSLTKAINHDPAHTLMNTGTTISGRPSMGSWMLYGSARKPKTCPAIACSSHAAADRTSSVAARNGTRAAQPFSGRAVAGEGRSCSYVKRPDGVDADRQRDVVNAVQQLNQLQNAAVQDPEITTRISQYEMVGMQMSVPELVDISKEPKGVLDLYGAQPGDGSFASNCPFARRLPSAACGSSNLSPRLGSSRRH